MSKYLSKLEICWTLLDWRGIVQAWNIDIEDLRHFQDTFRYLSRKPAGAVVSEGHGNEIGIVFWAEFWNYLSFLGFWDLKKSAQRTDVEALSIDEITITKFGAWIICPAWPKNGPWWTGTGPCASFPTSAPACTATPTSTATSRI